MEQEGYISTTKMVTGLLWAVVATLILSAWVVLLLDYDFRGVALMLAATASTLSAAAAVAHIRLYTLKVTQLIRITSGLASGPSGPSEGNGLRRVH